MSDDNQRRMRAAKRSVTLTEAEIKRIHEVIEDPKTSKTIRQRAQILLAASEKADKLRLTHDQIAAALGTSRSTVSRTVKKYNEEGLGSVLTFLHHPSSDDSKRKVDAKAEGIITQMACTKPPAGQKRWTVRQLVEKCAPLLDRPVSATTIRRVLARNDLKPHLSKYWCVLPDDPGKQKAFRERMEEVIEVYQQPLQEDCPVVCMDEKAYQQHDDVRPPLAMRCGSVAKMDSEYRRCGTSTIFLFVQPLTGRYCVRVRERRTAEDWAHEVRWLLSEVYPTAKCLTLIVDNLNVHSYKSLIKTFGEPEAQRLIQRLKLVFTPIHGSWLNSAECGLSILARQCLSERIATREKLAEEIRAWEETRNENPTPMHWHFTIEDARYKLKSLFASTDVALSNSVVA